MCVERHVKTMTRICCFLFCTLNRCANRMMEFVYLVADRLSERKNLAFHHVVQCFYFIAVFSRSVSSNEFYRRELPLDGILLVVLFSTQHGKG